MRTWIRGSNPSAPCAVCSMKETWKASQTTHLEVSPRSCALQRRLHNAEVRDQSFKVCKVRYIT